MFRIIIRVVFFWHFDIVSFEMRQCYQWFHGAKRRMNTMRFAKVQPVLFSIFIQWSKIADAIISRNMSKS